MGDQTQNICLFMTASVQDIMYLFNYKQMDINTIYKI